MIRALLLLTPMVGILAACQGDQTRAVPMVPVVTAPVVRRDVPVILVATGTVEPIQTVHVRAQVDGVVTQVRFKEGDNVTAGQVLFQIDPRRYQADFDKARATMARDQSQATQAQRDLERMQELATKEFVTAQQADQARATVAQMLATLRADSATVDQNRLNLEYAAVRAAVSGRTGSVLVKEGNLVRAGSDPLVVINQVAPIRVRFALPAADLARIRGSDYRTLRVWAMPVGDSAHAVLGILGFLDNAVDTLTGTIQLKAAFDNKDGVLWPGELVRIRLELEVEHQALVIPQAAVLTGQQGSVVFIVENGQATLRKIQVQRTSDSIAVLGGGLDPGMLVVVDGQLRLTEGAKVAVRQGDKTP